MARLVMEPEDLDSLAKLVEATLKDSLVASTERLVANTVAKEMAIWRKAHGLRLSEIEAKVDRLTTASKGHGKKTRRRNGAKASRQDKRMAKERSRSLLEAQEKERQIRLQATTRGTSKS